MVTALNKIFISSSTSWWKVSLRSSFEPHCFEIYNIKRIKVFGYPQIQNSALQCAINSSKAANHMQCPSHILIWSGIQVLYGMVWRGYFDMEWRPLSLGAPSANMDPALFPQVTKRKIHFLRKMPMVKNMENKQNRKKQFFSISFQNYGNLKFQVQFKNKCSSVGNRYLPNCVLN